MKKCCTVLVALWDSFACHLAPAVGSPAQQCFSSMWHSPLANHQTAVKCVTARLSEAAMFPGQLVVPTVGRRHHHWHRTRQVERGWCAPGCLIKASPCFVVVLPQQGDSQQHHHAKGFHFCMILMTMIPPSLIQDWQPKMQQPGCCISTQLHFSTCDCLGHAFTWVCFKQWLADECRVLTFFFQACDILWRSPLPFDPLSGSLSNESLQ